MLQDFKDEFERYKVVARKAIDQVPDNAINQVVGSGNNSVAMLMRHISGNLVSRFTDFLIAMVKSHGETGTLSLRM
jgi:hypothetical protein